jgi:hypothetical protein
MLFCDIRRINKDLKVCSPQFSTDLQCHIKVKKEKHPENRNYYNFSLYSDGIHPGYELSKYWLRKISDQMRRGVFDVGWLLRKHLFSASTDVTDTASIVITFQA